MGLGIAVAATIGQNALMVPVRKQESEAMTKDAVTQCAVAADGHIPERANFRVGHDGSVSFPCAKAPEAGFARKIIKKGKNYCDGVVFPVTKPLAEGAEVSCHAAAQGR